MKVNLDELILPHFRQAMKDIIDCNVDEAIFKGGRASVKSQSVSEAIIVGCMLYKESAVAAVKYANKIEERLVNTFKESIRYMGIERWWKLRKSPFEYVLLDSKGNETDVSVKFTGCDNPESIKSFKPRAGSVRYVWYEEASNFTSKKEIDSLNQTFARGYGAHCVVLTYNPPMQTSNWINTAFNNVQGEVLNSDKHSIYSEYEFEYAPGICKKIRRLVHKSTYLDVIAAGKADWLGATFIGIAAKTKEDNPRYYRWAYLGEVVGTEANVFSNVHTWDGKVPQNCTEIFRGLDHGLGGSDPSAYVGWYYDRRNRKIYCSQEYVKAKASIDEVAFNIKQFNKHNFPVYTESATPILNNQLRSIGINCVDVKKGKDSVRAGIKWLQGLNGIYIDNLKCPTTFKEFMEYEYKLDKDDKPTTEPSDKNNHTIDATRYALSIEIKYNE